MYGMHFRITKQRNLQMQTTYVLMEQWKILGLIELDSGIKDTCQFVGKWPKVVNAILVTTQPPSTEGMYFGPFHLKRI